MTKYVPENEKLLNKVVVKSDIPEVPSDQLKTYIKQESNNYFLSVARISLALYNCSSSDTTKWINRWLRKIGEAPVIYDRSLTQNSQTELVKELANKGYWHAEVNVIEKENKQRIKLIYDIKGNAPYTIRNYNIEIPDDSIMAILGQRNMQNVPQKGVLFNVDLLGSERENVAQILRRKGYYYFQKEALRFIADSALQSNEVDVVLRLQDNYLKNDSILKRLFQTKQVGKIIIYDISNPATLSGQYIAQELDTVIMDYFTVIHNKKPNFSSKILISKTLIKPNSLYNERLVERTYTSLNGLQSIKYVDISFREGDNNQLECIIVVTPTKPHAVAIDVEGTNSDGDLGVGLGLTYTNKNIFKGAEIFKVGVHGSYEMMGTGNGINNASEIGGDMSLKLPFFMLPFATRDFRRKMGGSTEFSVSYNFQQRPEYRRNIANAGMKYAWRSKGTRFTLDLLNINYIYLPWMTEAFKAQYLSPSSSVRYSYEDHLIMRIGFGASYSTQRTAATNYYTLRGNVSTAGNILYGLSHAFNQQKNDDGHYEIFNIAYSQYVKGDFDFTYNHYFNKKNRLVFHAGVGIGYPYGNASILPFEERYFSGGANSVRGWSVRSLGPGKYINSGDIDYMNQSGDIKLDLNVEARFKLFWKFEGAVFVDAGNIWTIKDYAEQAGGYFQFDEFYKQIACSYGAGIRADFDFFIIRVDMGIKLYEPSGATLNDRWRSELSFKNDFAFHFAVGYPF